MIYQQFAMKCGCSHLSSLMSSRLGVLAQPMMMSLFKACLFTFELYLFTHYSTFLLFIVLIYSLQYLFTHYSTYLLVIVLIHSLQYLFTHYSTYFTHYSTYLLITVLILVDTKILWCLVIHVLNFASLSVHSSCWTRNYNSVHCKYLINEFCSPGIANAFNESLVPHPELVTFIGNYFKTSDLSTPPMKMAHVGKHFMHLLIQIIHYW
jgi:hypothetical protein